MENYSQAISFANSYFSLVDGLVPGLENYLSERVVLDWFGRTIRGKKNVTEFMKTHKVGSRHVFDSIVPVNEINYKKSSQRKTHKEKLSFDRNDNNPPATDLNKRNELNLDRLSITENNNVLLENSNNVFYNDENDRNEISMTYEICENDLANLFALEITPTRVEDIEADIKQIKLNEELQKVHKKEGSGSEGINFVESTKYIEANGQIVFSKKSNKRGTELQTWKRYSQLKIAYSVITGESLINRSGNNDVIMEIEEEIDHNCYKISQKLPSLEEITEMSNKLVPNINNFGGYFSSYDFTVERDNFLENLNAELTALVNNKSSILKTPQYIDDRLVFTDVIDDKSNRGVQNFYSDRNENNQIDQGNTGFVFNYLIHLIIYQGNSKCRRNLTQEFDIPNENYS